MVSVMKVALLAVSLLNTYVAVDGLYFCGLQTFIGTRLSSLRSTHNFANSRTVLRSKSKRIESDDDSQLLLDTPVAYPQVPNFSGDTYELEKSGWVDTGAVADPYAVESAPPTPSALISKSFLLLNSVAIIWGTQHVVIKSALENFPSPSVLNFWRFALSFLLFLPAFVTVLVRNSYHMQLPLYSTFKILILKHHNSFHLLFHFFCCVHQSTKTYFQR